MKFGLTESQYEFIVKNVVKPLERKGARVWCYGSRARGDYSKFSDLDLMVESDADLSRDINGILEMLANSNFVFRVDIVPLSEFANAYLESFDKDKVLFVAGDSH